MKYEIKIFGVDNRGKTTLGGKGLSIKIWAAGKSKHLGFQRETNEDGILTGTYRASVKPDQIKGVQFTAQLKHIVNPPIPNAKFIYKIKGDRLFGEVYFVGKLPVMNSPKPAPILNLKPNPNR